MSGRKSRLYGRREFLASAAACAACGGGLFADGKPSRWYRGNMHLHTLLSDGRALPEEAAILYRDSGYDFVVFTDHNKVFGDEAVFVNAKNRRFLKEENIARFRKTFPGQVPAVRTEADGTVSYRLKTFRELSAELNDPGRFLVVSGCEYHNMLDDQHDLHCNMVNTGTGRKAKRMKNLEVSFRELWDTHRKACPEDKVKSMFVVNHPFWRHYDIDPMFLADHPEVGFFEIANTGGSPGCGNMKEAWTADKFWDIALAHRVSRGQRLLYALATDDTHVYDSFYDVMSGKKAAPRRSYVRVRAKELSADSLIDAMNAGDFYASTGLEFNDIGFDRSTGTLSVDVDPGKKRDVVIRFYGTKKGFDRTVGEGAEYLLDDLLLKQGRKPYIGLKGKKRRIRTFSDDIGIVLKEVRGTKASYRLRPDDLYVRAKAFVPAEKGDEDSIPVRTDVAWTQPYVL